MPIEAGATYVFDLGYYDYAWWAKLDAAGCRIVTRFKSNTRLAVTAELDAPEGGDILSDRIGLLPWRQARSRKNPFSDPVREVRVKTETGKVLRILCNDLDAPAQEIADLYKRRWAIELFLPLGQAEFEDPPISRPQRARRAHPNHRRPDHLPVAPPRSGRPGSRSKSARIRPPRARQSHASKAHRPPARAQANETEEYRSNGDPMDLIPKG